MAEYRHLITANAQSIEKIMTEIHFKQHWKTFLLTGVTILGFEIVALLAEVKLLEKGDYFGILLIQAIAVILLVGFTYPLIINRQTIFYNEGISFIDKFKRRFIEWQEVKEVSNVSGNQYPIILMKSQKGKVRIHFSQYTEKEKLSAFLSKKLS